MTYYPTLAEDVKQAKAIIERGINGADLYAAQKLLASFVEVIEVIDVKVCELALRHRALIRVRRVVVEEVPELYDVAKQASHESGFPWTDPRTGTTYPPPAATSTPTAADDEPAPCREFRPDHNGECLNCDDWIDVHSPEAIAAGERRAKEPGE